MTQIEQTGSPGRAGGKIEYVRQREARRLARRSFMRVSVFAGLTLSVGAMTTGTLAFFNLRKPTGFGGVVNVVKERIPAKGAEPSRISEAKCWIVNLQGSEGDVLGVGGTGGIMALY